MQKRLQIHCPTGDPNDPTTEVLLDGKKIEGLTSVTFRMNGGGVLYVALEIESPDLVVDALVFEKPR